MCDECDHIAWCSCLQELGPSLIDPTSLHGERRNCCASVCQGDPSGRPDFLTGFTGCAGLQTGFLAERRQKEARGGCCCVFIFFGWGGGGSICPALLPACLRSPSSRLQASFFLSKQAEDFLGAPSGLGPAETWSAWAICC